MRPVAAPRSPRLLTFVLSPLHAPEARGSALTKARHTATHCFGSCLGAHKPSAASSPSSSPPRRTSIHLQEPPRRVESSNSKKTTQHVSGKGKAPFIPSPRKSSSSSSPDWTPSKEVGGSSGVKGHNSQAPPKKVTTPGWSTVGYRP